MDLEAKRAAERIRKAQYRVKQKLISDGKYVTTAIELAKELLDSMDEPDVAAAFTDPKIGEQLKPDDKKALHNFAYHLKARRRKEKEEEAR